MADGTGHPPHTKQPRAADGRPVGIGAPGFADVAGKLLDNGYEPLPVLPGTKRPALQRWSTIAIDEASVEAWIDHYPHCSVGLRTGTLVGVDIDLLDPDLAHSLQTLALDRLGPAPIRVGRWPKRLLLYRTANPFAKLSIRRVEVLGQGQQFAAFGLHPDTRQPYHWPLGETPLDVPLDALEPVDEEACRRFLVEAAALLPAGSPRGTWQKPDRTTAAPAPGPVRDAQGQVVDGRDGWLSSIAYHAVHDAIASGWPLNPELLTERVWERFAANADLSRPDKKGIPYSREHARTKVADKLRLLAEGRLPSRHAPPVEEAAREATRSAADARTELERALAPLASPSRNGMAASPAAPLRRSESAPRSASARALRRDGIFSRCAHGLRPPAPQRGSSSSRPRTPSRKRPPLPGGAKASRSRCTAGTRPAIL